MLLLSIYVISIVILLSLHFCVILHLRYNSKIREVRQMPASKAQQRAVAKYQNENYDKFLLRFLEKGEKSQVQEHAMEMCESLNGFVNRAIKETLERDKKGDASKPAKKKVPPKKATNDRIDFGEALNDAVKEHLIETKETLNEFLKRAAFELICMDRYLRFEVSDDYKGFLRTGKVPDMSPENDMPAVKERYDEDGYSIQPEYAKVKATDAPGAKNEGIRFRDF